MKSFDVKLTSVTDVKTFSAAAGKLDADIDVVAGRYIIDAKSIMGLFSLDLSGPVRVEVNGTDAEAESFRKSIEQFVV
ncbi:HPr family phosphocarrier protein [Oscillospiraceae bacterium OttesenSCG-928-G22]|nr:HPr family phosphocarrier protein [Oscillospiraceae bacterium OttesenSCG-928-G22]